ncbi:hypothetical protein RRG08_025602 [Elysia crispata]|uniref:Uncharacterized protein n=1 Tax=Elysia crispata TaxID=231223 RepID=A0AAE1CXU6_9GAST|nr:hypothetical protein RRG08_025602 [Elysia crispata]
MHVQSEVSGVVNCPTPLYLLLPGFQHRARPRAVSTTSNYHQLASTRGVKLRRDLQLQLACLAEPADPFLRPRRLISLDSLRWASPPGMIYLRWSDGQLVNTAGLSQHRCGLQRR